MCRINSTLAALVLGLVLMGCNRETEPRGAELRKELRLDLPSPRHAAKAALAPTKFSQIWVVPARVQTAPNHVPPPEFYSKAPVDLATQSVLLSVPLGEPVRLLRHNYASPPSPGDLALGTGLSEVLQFSGNDTEATVAVPMTNAPYLLSSTPAEGGTALEAARFVLGFDQAMKPETLISDEGGLCQGTLYLQRTDNGVCEPLSPPSASDDHQVFILKARLSQGVAYELHLTPSAQAETGLYLPQAQKLAFSVAAEQTTSTTTTTNIQTDTTAPQLQSFYPANGATGISAGTEVHLLFSEPVQQSTLTVSTSGTACQGAVQLSKDEFATCVPFSGAPSTFDNQRFRLTPSALSETTTYQIRVTQAVKDLSNNALDKAYQTATGFTTSDTVSPQMTSTVPSNGAVSYVPADTIQVTFSEAMDPTSITVNPRGTACTGSIQLSTNGFSTCLPFAAQPTTTDNRTFQMTPSFVVAGQTYSLRVTNGATDANGNGATSSTVSFKSTVTASKVYAKDWMLYIKNNGSTVLNSTGAACDGTETGFDACLNAGMYHLVPATGKNSCTGLSAADSAGAFVWHCNAATTPVSFFPVRFAQNKGLKDLLDWSSATPTWKNVAVTIQSGGTDYLQSTPKAFGALPIKVQNTPGTLSTPGQIYAITQNPQGVFTVGAGNVAILSKPGITVSGSASTSEVLFDQTSQAYVWYEVDINSPDDYTAFKATTSKWVTINDSRIHLPGPSLNTAILMQGVKWLQLSSVKEDGGRTAINVASWGVTHPNYLDLRHVDIGPYGKITLTNLFGVRAYGLRLSESTTYDALTITSSTQLTQYALFQDLKISNAGGDAITFNGTFKGLIMSGVVYSGWETGNSTLPTSGIQQHYTGANFSWRPVLSSTPNGLSLHNHFYYNTGGGLWFSNGALNSQIHDLAMSHATTLMTTNGTAESNPSYVTGQVIYNSAIIPSCTTNNTVIGNGFTANCAAAGPSTHTLTGKSGLNNAVVGQLSTPDPTNTTTGLTGVGKLYDYTTDWLNPTIADWLNWSHDFRLWVRRPDAAWPDAGNQGRCATGATCKQADLALRASDSTVRNVHSLPTGNDVIRHVFQDATTSADCAAIPGATWGPNFCSHPAYATELACGSCADGTSVDYGTCLINNQVDQWTGPTWCTVISSTVANCGTAGGTIKSHNWKSNKCHITYLKHAEEIWGDGIGNDNALCESNEACLFTPNLGAYQGHGALVSAGSFTDGTLTGVTLYKYSTNGY